MELLICAIGKGSLEKKSRLQRDLNTCPQLSYEGKLLGACGKVNLVIDSTEVKDSNPAEVDFFF